MIPIIFVIQGKAWNRKTILMLLATVAVIVSVSKFTSFLDSMLVETQYSDLITNEIWINDDGTNIFRVLFYSVPALLSVFGRKYVDEADDRVINISVNCAAVTAFLYLLARFTVRNLYWTPSNLHNISGIYLCSLVNKSYVLQKFCTSCEKWADSWIFGILLLSDAYDMADIVEEKKCL